MDRDHSRGAPRRQWRTLTWPSRTRDGRLKQRCLIVCHRRRGHGPTAIAGWLGCHRSTADRVRKRCCLEGEAGLVGRRGDTGEVKSVRWSARSSATSPNATAGSPGASPAKPLIYAGARHEQDCRTITDG